MTAPYVVVWRVTESCNLGCSFCLYDKKLTKPRKSSDPAHIRKFIDLLNNYSSLTGTKVLISWLGGEPFIWPHIQDITKYASERGLLVSTTTNGTSLGSSKVRRHILDHYTELTISIDAIGETHDNLRGWNGGYTKLKTYVKALHAEKEVLGSLLKLKANIILMRDTIEDFPDLCHELGDWGIETITFNQLGGNDRPEFYPSNRLSLDDVDEVIDYLPDLQKSLVAKGITLLGSPAYMERIRASTLDQKMPVQDCGPGNNFLFVDENSRISPCSFTTSSYSVEVDAIKSTQDLLNLPAIFRDKQCKARAEACDDCQSTQHFEKFQTKAI